MEAAAGSSFATTRCRQATGRRWRTSRIEVPVSYPGAQLDMFYCHPPLALQSGAAIPQTQHLETITGLPFQRWSRHRQWDATRDTLATHLALVDEALHREVGQ